ncbi:MAG: PP2C family protein-serine/threonine phosphatase, partial [Spirulinaceae cyanobacterium]
IERIDTIDLGFPLGLIEDVVEFLAETKVELGPGDGIILYTDGITEAENEDGLHYGIERLCQVIQQHWSKSVGEICSEVISHLKEYIGEQKIYDDITLVAIKRKGLEIIELP